MTTKVKCFVEISLIKNKFIFFDFGDFAVIIRYNDYNNTDEFSIFFDDDYRNHFMDLLRQEIDYVTCSVEINYQDFEEFISFIPIWYKPVENKIWYLFNLLRRSFPEYITLYGR